MRRMKTLPAVLPDYYTCAAAATSGIICRRNDCETAMRTLVAALLLSAAPLAAPDRPPRTFAPRDVFALEQAADSQISPDGSASPMSARTGDIMTDSGRRAIWLVDTATGAQTPLRRRARRSRPRWSPDGSAARLCRRRRGGKPQLFVRWMATGPQRRDHQPARCAVGHRLVARRPAASPS